ncbi:riboflavin biosynthesis protein RibF [candidate division WOR-3 bacterium]|uniref:Riboflavin biosynthesis protein n=1 Tax=candidate division WOR-3 bacterium TaxID=2052148 RepID=A0A660SKW6_UNCW3|nr:MAG: riboflavin biosynthesis protein RibF [candidate division WOR-3 bacterium]
MKVYLERGQLRGPVVTIGAFDGIHLGHRILIETGKAIARARRKRFGIISFDPIPIQFFNPDFPMLLTTRSEKESILDLLGVDFIYYFRFDQKLARMEAKDFLKQIVARINPQVVVTGKDHHFGRDRRGGVYLYKRYFPEVLVIEPIRLGDVVCSSTVVRKELVMGRVNSAWRLLGRPYRFQGIVGPGHGKGRKLGFPTINLALVDDGKILPQDGVYLVRCHIQKKVYPGAMSIGPVRTIKEEHSIEIHLLDFAGDLYGEEVGVEILLRLRDLKQFTTADALSRQIRRDIELAKKLVVSL